MSRRDHLIQFYELLAELERVVGGKRKLADCSGRLTWPSRGVYFFFEPGEVRSGSGSGDEPRLVRVGTHALRPDSGTSLWGRLRQHAGSRVTGGGNHRGSIFRLLVGTALRATNQADAPVWGIAGDAAKAAATRGMARSQLLQEERPLEIAVSKYICAMPLLWLAVDDEPGPKSDRGLIERNSISLMSNYRKPAIDPASSGWLGSHCDRDRVRASGLWNSNHVDETYDPAFLQVLEAYIARQRSLAT